MPSHNPIAYTRSEPVVQPTSGVLEAPARSNAGLWLTGCLLLSMAQVLWAGYQLGAGNQSIQIPFLQRWIDPSLYSRDAMIVGTMGNYPSFFFRALAWVVPILGLPLTYVALHLLTAFAVLAAVYALARAMFRSDATAILAVLLLAAGHHRALGGEDLYSPGFTHTWAVFPLAILSLVMLYQERHWMAFALAGILFNFHALTAVYLIAILGFWAVCEIRSLGWRKVAGLLLVFLLCSSPMLVILLRQHQSFDGAWLALTHVRSAEHSFASSWWQAGCTDIPRFVLLIGLAALSLSFAAPSRQQRKGLLIATSVALLFIAGYVFAELIPVAAIIRAQLFRSSRLLVLLMLVHIAHGIVEAWRMAWWTEPRGTGASSVFSASGDASGVAPAAAEASPTSTDHGRGARATTVNRSPWLTWLGWLEFANASLVFACMAIPALLPMLPLAFVLSILVGLLHGRVNWAQSLCATLCLIVCLLAWRSIHFPLIGLGDIGGGRTATWPTLAACVVGAGFLWAVAGLLRQRRHPRWLAPLVTLIAVSCYIVAAGRIGMVLAGNRTADPWVSAQVWAKDHTPVDALFLTPTQPGGFRIHSQRSVVGEWRDGTQLYFSASFGPVWWERMNALQPGLLRDTTGNRLLSRGKSLDDLDDQQILDLCKRYPATHILLPAGKKRSLQRVYENSAYAIYLPVLPPPPPPESVSVESSQDQFMQRVVLPNIEKYRKSDVKIQVVDASGRAVYDLPFEVHQTKQAFGFSCSLPFFQEPAGPSTGDFKPPPVTDKELAHLPEIFNTSLIPFSGKWMYIEPQEGQRHYEDLDRYVQWCTQNGLGMEFHFLSGYPPAWLRRKTTEEQGQLFLRHARGLLTRYGDRIRYWQVVNEAIQLQQSPAVFAEIRRLFPNAKLGIGHCAQFYSARPSPQREKEMRRGLDEVLWLKTQGVQLDFFAFHGHRPFGVWPEASDMYDALDAYAKEGVKIHISEFTAPLDVPVLGTVRTGRWTPELQAEFYEYYYTVCFSHPAVELINLWGIGPVTWQPGSGLLDRSYEPKPAFNALKDLIRTRWMTRTSGKLALDGTATFRGFHGEYEVSVTLPSGATAKAQFGVQPSVQNQYRLRLDRETGKLELIR